MMVASTTSLDTVLELCGALTTALGRFEREHDPYPRSAAAMLALYRRRSLAFAGARVRFDDPSWIILLDLYVRPAGSAAAAPS